MTLIEWLIRRARKFWDHGKNIPMDLFAEMNSAGLDVQSLENKYMKAT